MGLQQITFENIVTKGEIGQNEQFLIFPEFFQFFQWVPSLLKIFHFFPICFQILQICCMWERVKKYIKQLFMGHKSGNIYNCKIILQQQNNRAKKY